jgi:hypothetical protein
MTNSEIGSGAQLQSSENEQESSPQWISALGVEMPPDFAPRTGNPRLTIILRCEHGSAPEIVSSVADILSSTFQDYSVQIVGCERNRQDLSDWLGTDERFSFVKRGGDVTPTGKFVLVFDAGWRMTRYSLEALLAAVQTPGVQLVRALTEGRRGSLEMWDGSLLRSVPASEAEKLARAEGVERWMSAEDAGIYSHGRPAPKVFFRKGKADRHIVEISIWESKRDRPARPESVRIKELEKEVERLRAVLSLRSIRPKSYRTRTIVTGISRRILRRIKSVSARIGGGSSQKYLPQPARPRK